MRAFVINGPLSGGVQEAPEPQPAATEVIVDVDTVGLCGTDVELFAGTMPYLQEGITTYPVRPGHEWSGTVREIGAQVRMFQPGDRVTGDTFQGCGACERCQAGRHHLCKSRYEMGVRGGRPGALAERVAVPAAALHKIPEGMSAATAAFVEPGSCALRAVKASGVCAGATTLVWGTGTLGMLAAQFARTLGASVCLVGNAPEQRDLAARLGFGDIATPEDLGSRLFECVIDATGAPNVPGDALNHVTPGGRIALLGVAAEPATLDANHIVLNDITVVGVLGGSTLIDETITLLARGDIATEPLIAATVALEDVAAVLAVGCRIPGAHAPKVHVEPSLTRSTQQDRP